MAGARVAILGTGVRPLAAPGARPAGATLSSPAPGCTNTLHTGGYPTPKLQGGDAVAPPGAPATRFVNPSGAARTDSRSWPARRKPPVGDISAGPARRVTEQGLAPRPPEGHPRHLLSPSAGTRVAEPKAGLALARRVAPGPCPTVPHNLRPSVCSQPEPEGARLTRACRAVHQPAALGCSAEPILRHRPGALLARLPPALRMLPFGLIPGRSLSRSSSRMAAAFCLYPQAALSLRRLAFSCCSSVSGALRPVPWGCLPLDPWPLLPFPEAWGGPLPLPCLPPCP